jgi:hypothetical protein
MNLTFEIGEEGDDPVHHLTSCCPCVAIPDENQQNLKKREEMTGSGSTMGYRSSATH